MALVFCVRSRGAWRHVTAIGALHDEITDRADIDEYKVASISSTLIEDREIIDCAHSLKNPLFAAIIMFGTAVSRF